MSEKEIFRKYYGPFEQVTFVMLEDYGESYRVSLDKGPEFHTERIFNDSHIAYKILPGRVAEIRVTAFYGQAKLSFHCSQSPVIEQTAKGSKQAQTTSEDEDLCGSINCEEQFPCPNANEPILICPEGGELDCGPGGG